MEMPQLRLSQTYAKIGMNIEKPKQSIQQPPATMEIRQEPANLEIVRTAPNLRIDQTQAWNEMNLKDPFTLTRDEAREAYQQWLEGIARRAAEGERLAAIENKGNPIAEIAQQSGSPGPANINIAFIPGYGSVKVDFIPGELHMNWKQGGAFINTEMNRPIHEYTPGKVEVYLKQKQSLTIDFTGREVDLKL